MTNLVDLAAMKQPVEFADAFNQAMGEKVSQRIEAMRQGIAQTMFSSEEDYDEDFEDEEEYDEEDLDLEDLDIDELLGDEDEDA